MLFQDWVGVLLTIGEVAVVLWCLEVVRGVVWMSMSGAVALWYVKDCGAESKWCSFGGGCGALAVP